MLRASFIWVLQFLLSWCRHSNCISNLCFQISTVLYAIFWWWTLLLKPKKWLDWMSIETGRAIYMYGRLCAHTCVSMNIHDWTISSYETTASYATAKPLARMRPQPRGMTADGWRSVYATHSLSVPIKSFWKLFVGATEYQLIWQMALKHDDGFTGLIGCLCDLSLLSYTKVRNS